MRNVPPKANWAADIGRLRSQLAEIQTRKVLKMERSEYMKERRKRLKVAGPASPGYPARAPNKPDISRSLTCHLSVAPNGAPDCRQAFGYSFRKQSFYPRALGIVMPL